MQNKHILATHFLLMKFPNLIFLSAIYMLYAGVEKDCDQTKEVRRAYNKCTFFSVQRCCDY